MAQKNRWTLVFFAIPTLLFYFYFFISPLANTFYVSFFDWDGLSEQFFVGLNNYIELFQDPIFYSALWNSFYWVILVVLIQIPIAFFLAYFLYQRVKGFRLLRTIYFVPVVTSSVAISLAFSFIYNAQFGILNSFLNMIGLGDLTTDWLSNPSTAVTAVAIPFVWQFIGLMMIILYSGLQAIPDDLIEAGEVDGVNAVQKIIYIILPSMKPVLSMCLILAITYAFKQFDYVLLLTGGGPVYLTEVSGSYMYNQGFSENNYGYGNAIAVAMMVIVVIIAFVINKIFKTDD
ncbi:carbohydrate ABC transporter permease [Amphibacillus cookii]|uniref:carbohydrate ABC transporter permease n=1 Tax=Amphibacillus cookii TaxID=767787 RepID=UPI0019590199|nr:sugar ABC transporter permease [Amphibacillus cookii]MBM7540302.1 raffinose/stachyose/melibiose transport system permease protein [Amphibacillus cookii]